MAIRPNLYWLLSAWLALSGCASDKDDGAIVAPSAPSERATTGALPPCPTCVVLPIEVLGPVGTTASATFVLPEGTATSLFLQVHGLALQDMASVQLNDGPWTALSNTTVTLPRQQARYGGIGGAFATLKLTLALTPGAVVAGKNVVRFRFDKSDGRTLGFRVLKLNVLDSNGAKLLDEAAVFRDEDVTTWAPPSALPDDVGAGERLWRTASLRRSPLDPTRLKATCSDCHAQDGRDLKYFNYSNRSIVERAKFHGLSEDEGRLIASYIRTNPSVAPGRPWSPPYQPGPGLTKRPVSEWSAGAGIDAVLDEDAAGFDALPAGGKDPAALIDRKYLRALDIHELPIPLQLLDWNHWLPAVHPKDSLGADFEKLDNFKLYGKLRAALLAPTKESYVRSGLVDDLFRWGNSMTYTYGAAKGLYDLAMPSGTVTNEQYLAAYFGGTWNATKLWELTHEFDLEGLGPQLYGASGDARSWQSNRHVFDVSPHIIHQLRIDQPFLSKAITHGDCAPGLMNAYLANAWYALQLQLNSGSRLQGYGGHHTIDWGYTAGLFGDLRGASNNSEPLRRWIFTLKSFEAHDSSLGPEQPNGPWWTFNLRDASITSLALGEDWSRVPERDAYVETALRVWVEKAGEFSVEQWRATGGYDGSNFDPPTWIIGSGTGEQNDRSMATGIYRTLQRAQSSFHVHGAVLAAIARFGKALWPNNDWDQFRAAPAASSAAPAGLTASAGVEQATLSWRAVPSATSYNVLRASTAGGPYLTVALLRGAAPYIDGLLDAGTTYFYRVTANVGGFEGPPSREVAVVPATGLVGSWAFDDNAVGVATDKSATGNVGALIGGATPIAGPGRHRALLLDGKSGFVSVRRSLHHWLGGSATLAAWIKTRAGGGGSYYTNPGIAGRAGGGGDELYWGTIDRQGRIGMAVGGGDGQRVQSPTPINDDQWHHVAFSRELGTGALKVYVDGKLVASGTGEKRRYLGRFFSIGRTDLTTNYLDGALADVRIYDKALSDRELAALAADR